MLGGVGRLLALPVIRPCLKSGSRPGVIMSIVLTEWSSAETEATAL